MHGDLRYARSDDPSTAWAYHPSTFPEGGDSWYRNGTYNNPVLGNYAFHTFLHETGHALGLKHGQESGVYGAMTAAHDSMEYSVMTYRSYVGDPLGGGYANETWGYAQSLMMYDIAALQYMYGANYSTNSGNTTYTWSSTTGAMSVNGVNQGTPGGNRIFMTVWDGGGTDTYDFSNYSTNLNVSPGPWRMDHHLRRSTCSPRRVRRWFAFRGRQHRKCPPVPGQHRFIDRKCDRRLRRRHADRQPGREHSQRK